MDFKNNIAVAICEVFPTLNPNVVFTGGSSGKLYNRFGKLRHKMNGVMMISSRTYYQKQPNPKEAEVEIEHDEDAIEASMQWVKINSDPWPDVLKNWKTSLPARQLLLKTAPVHEYLELFSCVANNNFLKLVGSSTFLIQFEF
jgi:hypothetical protein